MKKNRRIAMSDAFINEHKLSTKAPPKDSLFWTLWNSCEEIAHQALATDFVQGIKAGTLDPVKYGGFNVSDAYYCFHGADDYLKAASKATDPTLKAFLTKKYNSYVSYNNTFPKTWHVKNAEGIEPIDVCRDYSEFERQTVSKLAPIYCLIVMLPCEYLWAWLGAELAPPTKGNVYAPWITGNNDPSGAYAMGNFIDAYQKTKPIEYSMAQMIYAKAMTYEFNNFQAATL